MAALADIIRYFRDCYQADNRELTLYNFFSEKVEHRLFMQGEEILLTGSLPFTPLETTKAENIRKTLQLYSKEKELYYASFFIVGSTHRIPVRDQVLCAPLFLYPATLTPDTDWHELSVDHGRQQINTSLLHAIRDDASASSDDLVEKLAEQLPHAAIGFPEAQKIARLLKHYAPALDVSLLLEYPGLIPEKEIKEQLKQAVNGRNETTLLIPASALGVIRKSSDTLGVLNELAAIAQSPRFSTPLQALSGTMSPARPEAVKPGRVPAILSQAQQRVLQSAAIHPQTLIIGPPGTGKSYTLAALAIHYVSQGKSVLIASRSDQAVNVIAGKIENQLHIRDILIRGGRKDYLRHLKNHLQNLLHNVHPAAEDSSVPVQSLIQQLRQLDRHIATLESQFIRQASQEAVWGDYWAAYPQESGLWHSFKKGYIRWQTKRKRMPGELTAELEEAYQKRNALTIQYIRTKFTHQVRYTLRHKRKNIQLLLQALKARTGGRQEQLFGKIDFPVILRTLPVWLVNLSDVSEVLPLERELFDVAIIDEATQCDIAACIPVMFRAKKIVIAGDPNQLRHVSFVSRAKLRLLLQKNAIPDTEIERFNYRDKSILDLVSETITDQAQVIFLNEHFRSVPAIIRFSNETFYNGALRLMTQKPGTDASTPVQIVRCAGKRNAQGYNSAEAEAVTEAVAAIIHNQHGLDQASCTSIGILSPFRAQVDHIAAQISRRFSGTDIEKHQIMVGTAYQFQGEERDIMLLSFTVDNQSHSSAWIHLNKPDVFNVAITRAKTSQQLFLSADERILRPESLLKKYLESIHRKTDVAGSSPGRDTLVDEIYRELTGWGLRLWLNFPVAGIHLDLVIRYHENTYGIDLIGFPGEWSPALPLERYQVLARAGIHVFPLSFTRWRLSRETILAELRKFIRYTAPEHPAYQPGQPAERSVLP